jgi:hypothetical protein
MKSRPRQGSDNGRKWERPPQAAVVGQRLAIKNRASYRFNGFRGDKVPTWVAPSKTGAVGSKASAMAGFIVRCAFNPARTCARSEWKIPLPEEGNESA